MKQLHIFLKYEALCNHKKHYNNTKKHYTNMHKNIFTSL
jgi:hypothetical protein